MSNVSPSRCVGFVFVFQNKQQNTNICISMYCICAKGKWVPSTQFYVFLMRLKQKANSTDWNVSICVGNWFSFCKFSKTNEQISVEFCHFHAMLIRTLTHMHTFSFNTWHNISCFSEFYEHWTLLLIFCGFTSLLPTLSKLHYNKPKVFVRPTLLYVLNMEAMNSLLLYGGKNPLKFTTLNTYIEHTRDSSCMCVW